MKMNIKRFQTSLLFNTFLCWVLMLSPVWPIEPAGSVPGPGDGETCIHDCPDSIEYGPDGEVIKVTNCEGVDITPDPAGSTQNQNTGGSNDPGNDPTISYTDSSFCTTCMVTSPGMSDSPWQGSQDWGSQSIFTETSLSPPDDPLIFTPPQPFSAPQYTASPWLVQTVSMGDDFWGTSLGNLAVTIDPNSTAPLHITDVKMVLKRASGIFDIEAGIEADVDSNEDGITDHHEARYLTPTAYFIVQSDFVGSGHLNIFGYDHSATYLDGEGVRHVMENAPMFLNLTFTRAAVEGQPGITINGYQTDGSTTSTVNLSYVSMHDPGGQTLEEVEENGIRTVITGSFVAAADDADGWHHVKEKVISKAGPVAGQWVEWRHTSETWRTLINGREVLMESSSSEEGGATRTISYFYEEDFAFGGIRNRAFGKLKAKIMPDGTWEAYGYDPFTGMLTVTYKPWMDSPPPPMTPESPELAVPPLSNYAVNYKVETTTYDPSDDYKTSWKNIAVLGATVYDTTTTFVQDTAYSDAGLNQLWTKEVSENGEITTTRFLRDPDGYRRTLSTTNVAGVETRYEEHKGTVSADGLTFTADSAGTAKANITISPILTGGQAVAGKTKRTVTVSQVNGSTLLSYTEIATVSGAVAGAGFTRVDGRRYEYDAEFRLTGIFSLDGTALESHAYTATSHTVTDAEGIVTVTELDATTGRELAVIKSAVTHTSAHGTHQAPELRDTAAVADGPNGTVIESQTRVGTQTGQTAITGSHSTTRNALGQIVAKTDQAGRRTTYQYEEDGRLITETLPGGATRIRRQYLDRQLKSITGTAGPAEFHSYIPWTASVITTVNYGSEIDPPLQRIVTRRYPGGQMIAETTTTKHPVSGVYLTASGYSTEFAEYQNRPSRRINVSGTAEVMKYNEFGELEASGVDMNADQTLSASSTDIYTEMKSDTVQWENAWWERSITRRLTTNGDASSALTSTTWRKLGTGAGSEMLSVQPDGTEISIITTVDRAHAARTVTQTVTRPGGTPLVSTQLYVNGLLMAETQPGVTGAITHTYDGLERRVTTTDPRSGTVKWDYLPDGRLNWTKDAGNNQTSYAYYPADSIGAGRVQTITHPDTTTTTYEYDAQGRVTLQGGTSGYPVGYEYDQWGKMKKMKTWRDPAGDPDVTTWLNDPVLGVLEKTDAANETVSYSYLTGGALHTRTWARNLTTTYGYDDAGRLDSVDYSDATPDVSTTYDRLSRPQTITDGSGSRTQTYDGPAGAWDKLTYAADSTLGAVSVERGFDVQMREDELQVVQGGQPIASTGLTYHAGTGRIASISHGGSTATYDWTSTVAGLPVGISYNGAGLTGTRTPDAEGRLDKIAWSIGNADVLSHDYTLDNRGRRTAATREDGTHWDYGYNARGEVTSAAQERADDTLLPGRGFGYAFDAIGNRTQASVTFATPPPLQATTYTPNALNQYTTISRTNPLRRVLQGTAHPGATIEVKLDSPTGESRTVARVEPNGAGFVAEAEADTSIAAVWRQVVVEATRPGVGVNGAAVKTKRTGWLFFPPQNETLVYDQDGNLKEDARWLYTWDGENRLIAMEEKFIANSSLGHTPPARQRLEFAYDSQSRRVRKVVKVLQGQTWSVTSDHRFVYDAWNLLAELSMSPLPPLTSSPILLRSYAWGYDLSGTEQGAGGVGGLVLVSGPSTINSQPSTSAQAPCYDGNGNILAYIDCTTGTVTQRMEYDAFGVEMSLDSVLAQPSTNNSQLPFRFSTKYTDSETGLSYYGYRYYSAEVGRWTARDPIGERGGSNLYGMVENSPVSNVDILGQTNLYDCLEKACEVAFHGCLYSCALSWPSYVYEPYADLCVDVCRAIRDKCKSKIRST